MQTIRTENKEERERRASRELSSMRGPLGQRRDLVGEQNDIWQKHSFILACEDEELRGTPEAEEVFMLRARQAVM